MLGIGCLISVLICCKDKILLTKSVADNVPHLYKVLSVAAWHQSQQGTTLKTGVIDADFIHLATAEQLDRVLTKFWGNEAEYFVIEVDPKKFTGRLVLESNPGGETKYYHLYNGSIPLSSVIDVKRVLK